MVLESKLATRKPLEPLNMAPWSMALRSTNFLGVGGMTPPWYQETRMGPRQSLAGCSKWDSHSTGVTSGLKGSPLASAEVGILASTACQRRSMVWEPMSPIWPAPKSQYMFHSRQFMPAPPLKYSGE